MYPHPIEIPLLGLATSAHNFMVGGAVVVSIVLVTLSARGLERLGPGRTLLAVAIVALFAFAAGRAHFALIRPEAQLPLLRIDRSIHAGGAIVGIVVGAWLAARLLALPLGKLADACAPAAGIGIAIARMGCLAHGCCFGRTCSLPWCFGWPAGTVVHEWHWRAGTIPQDAPLSPTLHPLQIYFALLGLLMTVAALAAYRRKRYDGEVALLALTLFTGGSFLLEFLRVDYAERPYWGPLPQLTWTALALFALALAALARGSWAHRRRARPILGDLPVEAPAAPEAS